MRTIILISALGVALAGCATNGYQKFYHSYNNPASLKDVQLLQKDQEPTIYSSRNLNRDIKILVSKGYLPIGESSFNGALEGKGKLEVQARKVGAVTVLVKWRYTNTQTNIVPLFLPNNSTTYNSGLIYGYGGSASYSGSSTTYGTKVVPLKSQQRRYDQTAVYFVKLTKKFKYGIYLANLTPEIRASIQRNTGAIINTVMENSPAFMANLLTGDILIRVDGQKVINAQQAGELLKDSDPPNGESKLTILRRGEKKVITVDVNEL